MLLLANEFLDALPIRQLVRTAKGWRERMVGIEDDGFAFVSGPSPLDEAVPEAQRAAPGELEHARARARALAAARARALREEEVVLDDLVRLAEDVARPVVHVVLEARRPSREKTTREVWRFRFARIL